MVIKVVTFFKSWYLVINNQLSIDLDLLITLNIFYYENLVNKFFLIAFIFLFRTTCLSAAFIKSGRITNQSNIEANPNCYKTITEIASAELAETGLKTPSRTYCRVYFDVDSNVTNVRVRSPNADAIVLEPLSALLYGTSYCYTTPSETKETVFYLTFAVKVE